MREPALTLAGRQASDERLLGRMTTKFPTASIAVLAHTGDWPELTPGAARLVDFVIPREFAGGRARSG
jgi:phosphohistidine phosphatase